MDIWAKLVGSLTYVIVLLVCVAEGLGVTCHRVQWEGFHLADVMSIVARFISSYFQVYLRLNKCPRPSYFLSSKNVKYVFSVIKFGVTVNDSTQGIFHYK